MSWGTMARRVDEPHSMRPSGRDTFIYREGEYELEIYAERRAGKVNRYVDARGVMRWLPPHEAELVSQERRAQILANVRRYFEQRRETFVIDEGDASGGQSPRDSGET